ncbi:MAG TPA: prolyl oligopeptidase family serine peptidase [Solimonas sp.]|nr:prolyl oligopeptidase family serine peptidase [Solimonas sp.]
MSMKATGLVLACILGGTAHAADRTERGTLVMENVPEIPAPLAERINQYQQTRSATLQGWLPGERGILITTRFAETGQVHRVAQPGGDRSQLTFFPDAINGAAPAPDGKGFLYRKDSGGNEFFQLWWFDFASGKSRLLTDGKSRNEGGTWSNKGDRYAYSTTRRNGRDTDIHLGGLDLAESQPLVEREGSWSELDWSPDDRQLLVQKFISINESELHVVDVATRTTARFHWSKEPISFGAALFSRDGKGVYYISDEGSEFRQLRYENLDGTGARVLSADIPWDIEELALSDGGTYLAYVANADGISQLHVHDLKRDKAVALPALPVGVISGLRFERSGKRLGFELNSARSPADVWSIEIAKGQLARWTQSETGGLDSAEFTEPALVHYPAFDGRSIPAFVYRPAGKGPFPVLIVIHGGPEAQALPDFSAIREFYVRELGLAVVYPNVRGSAGYGKSYLLLDNGDKREDSVKDIGSLLDWIGSQPQLDAKRVAVTGGSYGGYMTLASLTHFSDRLRAGVDVVGISNFVTFLNNTQDYRRDLRRAEYGDERDPQMRAHLESISPLARAKDIRVPLFVVQGANDPRVPLSEAEQIVATVRQQGGEVWYLMAKDEGHGFRKKSNRDFQQNATVLFLQKYLLQ